MGGWPVTSNFHGWWRTDCHRVDVGQRVTHLCSSVSELLRCRRAIGVDGEVENLDARQRPVHKCSDSWRWLLADTPRLCRASAGCAVSASTVPASAPTDCCTSALGVLRHVAGCHASAFTRQHPASLPVAEVCTRVGTAAPSVD